jgi:Fe-coproporphyrin III synthase
VLSVSRLLNNRVEAADALRYGRESRRLPPHLLHYSRDKKPVVVWTSTRRCNLHCAHCYTDSLDRDYPGELTTVQALGMVDELAEFGSPVLLISGGEPLRRPDVMQVACHAVDRGMRVVLSTNGTLLTPEVALELRDIGLSYVGISIDGPPETHDRFRGARGAFEASMRGIAACQSAGLKTGLRVTLTRANQHSLPWIFDLLVQHDIHRLCIYHLAPTGRGSRLKDFALNHEETRRAMDLIFERTRALHDAGFEAEVLTADNHADAAYLWMDVARREPGRAGEVRELLRWNGGNQSGQAIACIDADGTVYADQFWRWRPLGNVTEQSFRDIWAESPAPLLRALRQRPERLPDRCRACRFLDVCNGNFRSRAEATTGDPWAPDPLCYLSDDEIAPAAEPVHAHH